MAKKIRRNKLVVPLRHRPPTTRRAFPTMLQLDRAKSILHCAIAGHAAKNARFGERGGWVMAGGNRSMAVFKRRDWERRGDGFFVPTNSTIKGANSGALTNCQATAMRETEWIADPFPDLLQLFRGRIVRSSSLTS